MLVKAQTLPRTCCIGLKLGTQVPEGMFKLSTNPCPKPFSESPKPVCTVEGRVVCFGVLVSLEKWVVNRRKWGWVGGVEHGEQDSVDRFSSRCLGMEIWASERQPLGDEGRIA